MSFEIKQNVSLAELTTLKIGGKALFFVHATTESQVFDSLKYAKSNSLEVFVLGGGSNVLISDEGFNGLVLQIGLKGIKQNGNIITAQAGEDWDDFVEHCVRENLAGIECLSGIPGFVGGTPVQNVGAYGQEVCETIESVRCLDRLTCEFIELSNSDCGFAYRTSIFNTTAKNRYVVLSVSYKLIPDGKPKIVYKDLKEIFGDKTPNLFETREAICRIRAEKAMLVRQGGLDSQSAGSFFKNPIVANERFTAICEQFGRTIPSFKSDENNVKIPAAWLIENAGFEKGFTLGKAGLSTKHALALTNRGNATAKDILRLKSEIQKTVFAKFGIELHPEPIFVGFQEGEMSR